MRVQRPRRIGQVFRVRLRFHVEVAAEVGFLDEGDAFRQAHDGKMFRRHAGDQGYARIIDMLQHFQQALIAVHHTGKVDRHALDVEPGGGPSHAPFLVCQPRCPFGTVPVQPVPAIECPVTVSALFGPGQTQSESVAAHRIRCYIQGNRHENRRYAPRRPGGCIAGSGSFHAASSTGGGCGGRRARQSPGRQPPSSTEGSVPGYPEMSSG